jgi:hypothetical protein
MKELWIGRWRIARKLAESTPAESALINRIKTQDARRGCFGPRPFFKISHAHFFIFFDTYHRITYHPIAAMFVYTPLKVY